MKEIPTHVLARVFSFDLKFIGSRRATFYRKLFGFSVRGRVYPGLLAELPHVRLGKSVLAVPKAAARHLDSFFAEPRWRPLELHSFDAILPADVRMRAMEDALNRPLVIGPKQRARLIDEIGALRSLVRRAPPEPELVERIRRVLRAADELCRLDWTDNREFSRKLEVQLAPLRKWT